jgi:hypothetical protein
MKKTHRAFQIVVWVGILANWSFVAWAIANPRQLLYRLELGPVDSTIWLFNYSVLLAILSCFYIPAAMDPFRYRVNAWLLITARIIPASTFFIGVWTGFMPSGFFKLGIADATIGVTALVLLRKLLPRHDSV